MNSNIASILLVIKGSNIMLNKSDVAIFNHTLKAMSISDNNT
jgi:hypothetical protein